MKNYWNSCDKQQSLEHKFSMKKRKNEQQESWTLKCGLIIKYLYFLWLQFHVEVSKRLNF